MQQSHNGIVLGIVKDLKDPAGLGRVHVTFPHLNDQLSNWARIASMMAGKDRGAFFRPEVGDEVLVAFEHSDPRRPYVLGAVWSRVDTPPADDGETAKNNWRFIKSRSGHVVKLDDTAGKEKIEIIASDGKQRLVFDCASKKIQVVSENGEVEVSAKQGSVKIEATKVEIKATGEMKLEAGGTLTIKGQMVNIN